MANNVPEMNEMGGKAGLLVLQGILAPCALLLWLTVGSWQQLLLLVVVAPPPTATGILQVLRPLEA